MPALGEAIFSMTIKVAFCLAFSYLLYPVVVETLPLPGPPIILLGQIFKEIFIGIFFGLTVKITFHAIHTASVFIATQSGLAFATLYDPSQKEQSNIFATLLSFTVVAAIFVSDTHHLFIRAIVGTYSIFNSSSVFNIADFNQSIITTISSSFELALKLSAPYFLIHLIISISNGILSRLMPSFQVFFVMTPVQVVITYFILLITLNSTISIQIEAMKKALMIVL
jgi:flagellar biosynthesis protein FliR